MYVIRLNNDEPRPTYLVRYEPKRRHTTIGPPTWKTEGMPILARKFSNAADAECLIESMSELFRAEYAPEVVPFQHAPEDCAGAGRIQSI